MIDEIEKIDILGGEGRKIVLVKLKDWETKAELIKEKRKLGRKRIYINHDMTKEERSTKNNKGKSRQRKKRREKSKHKIQEHRNRRKRIRKRRKKRIWWRKMFRKQKADGRREERV